ncbi:MAG: glycosyltransferase family 4 protein [Bacteroidota bacterium]
MSASATKTVLLFDADLQRYRQALYRYFAREMAREGYTLKVLYDRALNDADDDLFTGITYSFGGFRQAVKQHRPHLMILFVWLRYKFLLPFMLQNRLRGRRMVVWSHGINLQKKKQVLMNQLYYARQRLAHSLILYSKDQVQYIKANRSKVYVANNTLNFEEFPAVSETKEQLKAAQELNGKKVILFVGRINVNNRKIGHLIDLAQQLDDGYEVLVIGPGLETADEQRIAQTTGIRYLGSIYDPEEVARHFTMADLFIMPGAVGLAINHAFYYGVPFIAEDTHHGPEIVYLHEGHNGFLYRPDQKDDLCGKVKQILDDPDTYRTFSENAKQTVESEASTQLMLEGFLKAMRHAEKA